MCMCVCVCVHWCVAIRVRIGENLNKLEPSKRNAFWSQKPHTHPESTEHLLRLTCRCGSCLSSHICSPALISDMAYVTFDVGVYSITSFLCKFQYSHNTILHQAAFGLCHVHAFLNCAKHLNVNMFNMRFRQLVNVKFFWLFTLHITDFVLCKCEYIASNRAFVENVEVTENAKKSIEIAQRKPIPTDRHFNIK